MCGLALALVRSAQDLCIPRPGPYAFVMPKSKVVPFPSTRTSGDTWQIAYIRYPGWVEDDDGFYQPALALAASADTGHIGASDLVRPDELRIELMQAAMDSLEEASGKKPTTIEVENPELADALAVLLEGSGIEVSFRDELQLLTEPIREMCRELMADEPYKPATKVPGVTIDHLRAFAEAAERFREAAPWRYLDSSDIIELAAPRPAPNVRFACILSAHGECGLGLAEERDILEQGPDDEETAFGLLADRSTWSVTYFAPWEVPILEHEAWLEFGLPVDPDGRIPCAVQYGPKRRVRRASPKMLAFFEGLFRVLAETGEDDLDAGEWKKEVETSQGRLELVLSLPDLLSPPAPAEDRPSPFNPLRQGAAMDAIRQRLDQQEFESVEEMQAFLDSELVGKKLPEPAVEGPKDEARALALEATDTPGRRGVALARKALALDPDCPVAHLVLAERSPNPEIAVERYQAAFAAAERALGPEVFEDGVGSFWGISETRPYMEARLGLADALWLSGQHEEAAEHFAELLRLNPNDNQGIRDKLAPALMVLGMDKEAEKLLAHYANDITSAAAFNRALAAYRRKGDTKTARERLLKALDCNHHVAELLLDRLDVPDQLPGGYTLGSVEEAAYYVLEAHEAWELTPDALEWLTEVVDDGC